MSTKKELLKKKIVPAKKAMTQQSAADVTIKVNPALNRAMSQNNSVNKAVNKKESPLVFNFGIFLGT